MWQDTVIAIGQLCFVPAMVPTLTGPNKPATSTSVMNAVIVAIVGATQATLGLWFTATTAAVIVSIWMTLAIQRVRSNTTSASSPVELEGSCELVVDLQLQATPTPSSVQLHLDLPPSAVLRVRRRPYRATLAMRGRRGPR